MKQIKGQTFILDFDDLSATSEGLDDLMTVKEHYPGFKCTCFVSPLNPQLLTGKLKLEDYKRWTKAIRELDWLEIAPHGFGHVENEMERGKEKSELIVNAIEKAFDEIGLPYAKVFKAPYWQISTQAMRVLKDKGYKIAWNRDEKPPREFKDILYIYNWSIEESVPKEKKVVKGHGHVGGTMNNDISWCLPNLLNIPTNAKFKTVSEYLDIS